MASSTMSEKIDLLTSASNMGVDLPSDCKIGNCLVCATKVLSGSVDQVQINGQKFDDSVTEHGYCLTCISYPRSDLLLQALDEDDRCTAAFTNYLNSGNLSVLANINWK